MLVVSFIWKSEARGPFPWLVLMRIWLHEKLSKKLRNWPIFCVYRLKSFEMNCRINAFSAGGKNSSQESSFFYSRTKLKFLQNAHSNQSRRIRKSHNIKQNKTVFFVHKNCFLCVCKCKTTQLNSVTKQARNRNNGFISYIKVFRNKNFRFLFSIFWVDTLDTDRSYLVNFSTFLLSIGPSPFILSFVLLKN